jgi:molybdate transport system substrate-binding protein
VVAELPLSEDTPHPAHFLDEDPLSSEIFGDHSLAHSRLQISHLRHIYFYILLFRFDFMKPSRPLFLALVLVANLNHAAHAADLTVSAAASLTNAFKDLAPLFEAANPGTKVQFNFAASGLLLQQIAKGAPVDVFASADQDTMDQAQSQGLVKADRRRNFASNSVVVIVPTTARFVPLALRDLALPAVQRVAIGIPASVPVGRYTKAVLEAEGLWAGVEPKMIGAQTVRQALDYVARGEVDAGFVYATDAALLPDKVKLALTVATLKPVLYPAAPVVAGPNLSAGQKFVDFLTAPQAQAVLAKYGFGKP